jgi:PAS domain S-box-containing protein
MAQLGECVLIVNDLDEVIYFNHAQNQYGIPLQAGLPLGTLCHPEDLKAFTRALNHVRETGQGTEFMARTMDRSRQWLQFEMRAVPIHDESLPGAVGLIGCQARNSLLHSPEQVLRNVTDFILTLDQDYRVTYINHSPRMKSEDPVLGEPIFNLLREIDAPMIRRALELAAQGEPQQIEVPAPASQSHLRWLRVRIRAGFEAGNLIGYQLFATDVTDQREAERARNAAEERLRALAEHSQVIACILDPDGVIQHTTSAVVPVLGLLPEQILKRPMQMFLARKDRALFQDRMQTALANPGLTLPPFELRGSSLFGADRVFECVLTNLIHNPAVGGLVANGRDITSRKAIETALRQRAAESTTVSEIGRAISRLATPDEILHTVEVELAKVIDTRDLYIALYDELANEITFVIDYVDGVRRPPVRRTLRNGLTEHILRTRQPLVIHDDQLAIAASLGIQLIGKPSRSYLGVPILAGERVLGVISVQDYDRPGVYGQHYIDLLSTVAQQTGSALENARLYQTAQMELRIREQAEQQLAQQTVELASLYRASTRLLRPGETVIAAAEEISAVLTQEFRLADCGVMIVAPDHGSLRRAARAGRFQVRATAPLNLDGPGLTVAAARTGTLVYAPDVRSDPRYAANEPRTRSELAVPLLYGGKTIAVLDLQSDQPDAFDERAQRLILAFADQAALALASATLLERLTEARQAAEEANALKSEFLANTSHELRTPLTAILGSLRLVLNDDVEDAAAARNFIQIAHDAALNLLTIVNDLLDIAKIESGKMTLDIRNVDVAGAIAEAYMLLWVQADAKGLALDVRMPEHTLLARADSEKLGQILVNLIGNAVKFTTTGSVTISAESDPHEHTVILRVQDTGIGVSADKIQKLFEPFVQANGTSSRKYGGTGLGLSISRRLAEMMRGTLELHSPGDGLGTTVTLTLPLA